MIRFTWSKLREKQMGPKIKDNQMFKVKWKGCGQVYYTHNFRTSIS